MIYGNDRFIALFCILMVSISPTAVATHTFEWGVEVGDEFTYALQRKVLDQAFVKAIPDWMNFILAMDAGTKFIVTIMELDDIPASITLSDDLPLSHASLTLEGDSSAILTDATAFAIMIGDWEFHGEFLNFSFQDPEITVINTTEEWGLVQNSAFVFEGRIYNYYNEWRYEKTNGTLLYLRYRVTTWGTDFIDIIISQWEEGAPTLLAPEIQLSTVLMVAIGGCIAIIVAFLAYRWVKKPRGLAAELGR